MSGITRLLPVSVIKNVQRGTASIANAATSGTATITAVVLAKAFLIFSNDASTTLTDEVLTGTITNTTTLTFARQGNTGGINIVWQVVEYV